MKCYWHRGILCHPTGNLAKLRPQKLSTQQHPVRHSPGKAEGDSTEPIPVPTLCYLAFSPESHIQRDGTSAALKTKTGKPDFSGFPVFCRLKLKAAERT